MITITKVRDLEGMDGQKKALYKLSEPVKYSWFDEKNEDGTDVTTDHVIISAIAWPSETYIFPAREDGSFIRLSEMGGSEKNIFDHEVVIKNAGWVLAN